MGSESEVLSTLRVIDKRRFYAASEMHAIAKMYNVKARIWSAGIPLRKIDKRIFENIRNVAVETLVFGGRGATTEEICAKIEELIAMGRCGLGEKTYLPRRRA